MAHGAIVKMELLMNNKISYYSHHNKTIIMRHRIKNIKILLVMNQSIIQGNFSLCALLYFNTRRFLTLCKVMSELNYKNSK